MKGRKKNYQKLLRKSIKGNALRLLLYLQFLLFVRMKLSSMGSALKVPFAFQTLLKN